jgi:hypothetical protein
MISDDAGFDRAKLIQPEVMVPPLLWLVTDAAGRVTGRRFLGIHWDSALPPEQAAEKAGAPVAWTSIATMPITPSRLLRRAFIFHVLLRPALVRALISTLPGDSPTRGLDGAPGDQPTSEDATPTGVRPSC